MKTLQLKLPKNKPDLSMVTLIAADCIRPQAALNSLNINRTLCKFGKVILFTDSPVNYHDDEVEVRAIPKLNNLDDYSRFCILELPKHVETSHVLICQWDSQIVNPSKWQNSWLDYDYIGGCYHQQYFRQCVVGNGGFSLRSKFLLNCYEKMRWNNYYSQEDIRQTVHHREKWLELGVKYAPVEVAKHFCCLTEKYDDLKSFGFHDWRFGNDPHGIKHQQIANEPIEIEIVEEVLI